MSIELVVKVRSLAAEARIIRSLERKIRRRHERKRKPGDIPPASWWSLNAHRRFAVRSEARHSGLALGFLRGTAYRRIEAKCHRKPDWSRVEKIALRFSGQDPREIAQRFAEWKDGS